MGAEGLGENAPRSPVRRRMRIQARAGIAVRRRGWLWAVGNIGGAYIAEPGGGQGTLNFRHADDRTPRIDYLSFMSGARTAPRLLRIAMAAVFGFMSLGHGPTMSFAMARGDAEPHAGHHSMHQAADRHAGHAAHAHHAQHPPGEPAEAGTADMLQPPATCYSFGCFAAVGPVAMTAPSASVLLLERLGAPPPRAVHSDNPEPADPPPRLPA